MFGKLAIAAAASVSAAIMLTPLPAHAQSCGQLWHQRNSIYAQAGYCFQTPRARSVFGAGCFPPYGQLSGWQRQRVNQIQAQERYMGCPP